jgi:putative inorganic carbon (hco3(-)) transporter
VAILIGILALRKLWELPPSVTMCAAIALTVFSGGWSQMGFSGIPVNRLLVAVALAQVFLMAPGVAQIPRLRLRPVHLLMALAVFYVLASAAAAGTLGSEQSFLALFDVFGVAPFLLFLVAPAAFSRRRDRDLLLVTLVGLGAYLGLTAIFESLGPHSLIFPSYIHQADIASGGAVKAGGPFQSPTAAGFANFACAVAAMIALQQWRNRRARAFAAFVAVVCLFGCFVTLERGVWIAAVAATAAAALATRTGRRWLVPGLALAGLAIAGTLAVSSQLSQQTSARATYEQSVWDRQNQTSTGLRMVAAKPLFGFGFGRYEADSLDYFRQPADYPMSGYFHGVTIGVPDAILPIHDTYLSYAVELGLVGALLWLASVAWAVGGGIFSRGPAELRPWKIGLLAITVFFLAVSFVDPHTAPYPMVLLFVWAGVATGQPQTQEQARAAGPSLGGSPLPA